MKKNIVAGLTIFFLATGILSAEAVVPMGDSAKKLATKAGPKGEFYQGKERFPKDYFLVHQNLPYLVAVSLHHPKSSTLNLTKEQIDAIGKIKKRTVPEVVKVALKIKKLELELANNIAIESNSAKSQYSLVDEIGKLRISLTKAHLDCINEVRTVLTKEQYKKLLDYNKKSKNAKKSNKFKIDELVILPHPGKFIKQGKIKVSKEQNEKMTTEVKAVYAPIFQGKIREAFDLEKKVQRAVVKGKTKTDLKEMLDKIVKLKREAMDSRIDALNHIQKILTKEQWQKANKLTYK